jgi:hypothetical protein
MGAQTTVRRCELATLRGTMRHTQELVSRACLPREDLKFNTMLTYHADRSCFEPTAVKLTDNPPRCALQTHHRRTRQRKARMTRATTLR